MNHNLHLASIEPYREGYREQMISVWERSARATHHFVSAEDLDYYKTRVQEIDFQSFPVYCLIQKQKVIGFIGFAERSIETLFLDPDYIGKGFGSQLMKFALSEFNANYVEVNEQNTEAVKFYSKFGFVTRERTEKDPEGKNYPLLKMKRSGII
jgi:putative acetyltransferase